MLNTEIKIVWKGNCNYSCKKFECKSQNSNMNVLDNPHFVIKIGKWLKLKYYGHPEKRPDILWHHQWEMASEERPQKSLTDDTSLTRSG